MLLLLLVVVVLSQVTNMDYMFYEASSFNQNLCPWGQHYASSNTYTKMFSASGCPNKGDNDIPTSTNPTNTPNGPWCHTCT